MFNMLQNISPHFQGYIRENNAINQLGRVACGRKDFCPFFYRVLTELVSKMRDMQMDKTELGCLRAIVLFNPGTVMYTQTNTCAHSTIMQVRLKCHFSLINLPCYFFWQIPKTCVGMKPERVNEIPMTLNSSLVSLQKAVYTEYCILKKNKTIRQ